MGVPLIITQDAILLSQIQSSAAAADLGWQVCDTAPAVRRAWAGASLVIVGVDKAAMLAGLGLPLRTSLHVVGTDPDEVLAWSVPLGAPGLVLPRQAGFLAALFDQALHPGGGPGVMLRLFGATGGLGVSTLAAGLAVRAAKRGKKVALVELDPHGGGLDVMMGAERTPGWRWGDLVAARGHIADLLAHLPTVLGVAVVAASRSSLGDGLPAHHTNQAPPEAVAAVLASLRRSQDLVIVDHGRIPPGTDDTTLVVGADVRSVLAAASVLSADLVTTRQVVARTGPGRRLPRDLLAQSLGVPVLGVFPHDKGLPGALEAGDPPGRALGHTSRALDTLLDRLMP